MKIKVGDTVRIKEDLKEKMYKGLDADLEMLQYRGKIGVVTDVCSDDNTFQMDIDNDWWWNKKMVERITFPRMMEVSDYADFRDSRTREVVFYEPRSREPYVVIDDGKYILPYKYAREIQQSEPKKAPDELKEKVMALVDEIIELIKK